MSKNPYVPAKTEIDKYQKPIITIKEARKILGKQVSDRLSDEEVGRLIGGMAFLANRLLEAKSVQQNEKVGIM